MDPAEGVAVSTTTCPEAVTEEHAGPQLIPAVSPLTVPLPLPNFVTERKSGLTRKFSAFTLVPAEFEIVTLRRPGDASGAIVRVAVAKFELLICTLLAETPLPTFTFIGALKKFPLNVAVKVMPGAPLSGDMEINSMGAAVTLNELGCRDVITPDVTVTLRRPISAPEAMEMFAMA
jgi:hypothetical protein